MFKSKYVKLSQSEFDEIRTQFKLLQDENKKLKSRLTSTENIDKYNIKKENEELIAENKRLLDKDEILYSYEQSNKFQKKEIKLLKESLLDKEDTISSLKKLVISEKQVTDIIVERFKETKNDIKTLKSKIDAHKIYQDDIELVTLKDLL
jgi:6-pyruvoyl-tetrahydropterin synthase